MWSAPVNIQELIASDSGVPSALAALMLDSRVSFSRPPLYLTVRTRVVKAGFAVLNIAGSH